MPNQAEYFKRVKAPFGGMGVIAKCAIPKGTYFCYEGRVQRRAEANEYTLAIQAVTSVGGCDDQVAYIDGTPSSTSLLGGMNEFIWDQTANQFEFNDQGVVPALRAIVPKEPCYMYYGECFNWDEYKTVLLHELGATVLEGTKLFGHETYTTGATELVAILLSWSSPNLPLKRLGTGVERLLMAVIDDTIPKHLIHTVHPSFLGGNVPEPFGCWLERFLCSSVIINRSAFRKAHDPRVTFLPLADCMRCIAAGERSSKRSQPIVNYAEEGDTITLLSDSSMKNTARRMSHTRVTALTAENDPLKGRADSEVGLSEDELNGFIYADRDSVDTLGDIGDTLHQWNLSMAILKDQDGASTMRAIQEAVDSGEDSQLNVVSHAGKNLTLQRRVNYQMRMDWYGQIEDRGWCGWLMLEWLDRRRTHPNAKPLKLSGSRDADLLVAFLARLQRGMSHRKHRDVVQRCIVVLQQDPSSVIGSESGLWLDTQMLPSLNLGFPVFVWVIVNDIARLEMSSTWGSGPHTAAQLQEALSEAGHMSLCVGHFCPFWSPGGLPSWEELITQLDSATRTKLGNEPLVTLGNLDTPSIPPQMEGH